MNIKKISIFSINLKFLILCLFFEQTKIKNTNNGITTDVCLIIFLPANSGPARYEIPIVDSTIKKIIKVFIFKKFSFSNFLRNK